MEFELRPTLVDPAIASDIKKQAEFYRDAEITHSNIQEFKKSLLKQQHEFLLLLRYYQKHNGRIAVYEPDSADEDLVEMLAHEDPQNLRRFKYDYAFMRAAGRALYGHPNLGTDNESWCYLDRGGHRVWIQNMQLDDTVRGSCSRPFSSGCTKRTSSDDVVIVKVPEHGAHRSLLSDYEMQYRENEARQSGARLLGPASLHFDRDSLRVARRLESELSCNRNVRRRPRTSVLASEKKRLKNENYPQNYIEATEYYRTLEKADYGSRRKESADFQLDLNETLLSNFNSKRSSNVTPSPSIHRSESQPQSSLPLNNNITQGLVPRRHSTPVEIESFIAKTKNCAKHFSRYK